MNLATDLSKYIFLPKKRHGNQVHQPLLVSKERLSLEDAEPSIEYGSYHNLIDRAQNYSMVASYDLDPNGYLGFLTWSESHKVLQNMNPQHIMLNPRRFIDFLDLLISSETYDGDGNKLSEVETKSILEQIIGKDKYAKSEYLDMHFDIQMGEMVVNYNHVVLDNKLIPRNMELLEDYSMVSSTSQDLYHWINNSNPQGLPKENYEGVFTSNLYYNPPRNGCIVAFRAVPISKNFFTNVFDCDESLDYYTPLQGVRPVLPCN